MPGLIHDISSSGATVFVEPMAVVNANNEIRELKGKEQIEIRRILAELTAGAALIIDGLKIDAENLAMLDFLFAKGKFSLDMGGSAPIAWAEAAINIKKGRHPLISKDEVVPTDFWTSEGVNTVIITGPNTGGKTVALKTVGLFTLMGQAGLNIPAASGSSIRIFDKVFADIGDEQSIEQSLSTFSSHMKNIVRILEAADDRTLALFDEIGAGTDPTEGAALAKSILECLHQTGAYSVATTHYSELKQYALTAKGVENACCEFDVATLRPTYRLLIGIPGKSNAFAISERLGLQGHILTRAKEFLTQEDVKFEDVLLSIEKNRAAAEEERAKAENLRQDIEKLKDSLKKQKGKFEDQKDAAIKAAKEEARKYLLDVKRDAMEILESMKQLENAIIVEYGRKEAEWQGKEAEWQGNEGEWQGKEAEGLRRKLKKMLDGVEAELVESVLGGKGRLDPPKGLKVGDTVLIHNLNQRGNVLKLPDKNGDALIQVGIMKIMSHVSNLVLIDENKGKAAKPSGAGAGAGAGASRVKDFRSELDLRGTRLEEAVHQVDKYIDDASLTGLSEVTIIHGKGTGALRSGIQKYLKGNKAVKSFRGGDYGEGDSGVTVVTLR